MNSEKTRHWHGKQSNQEPAYNLVSPSGSLEAPLAHYLHQPSLNSLRRTDPVAETADESNGCIAMVMGNAFPQDTLIFDHLHRRSMDCEDLEDYPTAVLAAHERHTHTLIASSAAKVILTYGQRV
jgi:hypothetical protein